MTLSHGVDRRRFCRLLSSTLPFLSLSASPLFASDKREQEPHFFLNFIISGGADVTYLFDARPLEFTDAGRLQNYLYKNAAIGSQVLKDPTPLRWEGSNGVATLVTPLANPLEKYRQHFSILNGVVMLANGLVGHGQNLYFLFNGQSGNGASFVPILGSTRGTPLDSVHVGGFEGDGNDPPNNFSGSVALNADTGLILAEDLRKGIKLDLNTKTSAFIQQRMTQNSSGAGLFSQGTRKLLQGFQRAPQLSDALKSVTDSADTTGLSTALQVAYQYFMRGVTSCMTIMIDYDPDIDTHDKENAQEQPAKYKSLLDELAMVFQWLTTTPFDAANGKSFLDVTTVMISSEFSRTMRQERTEIDATGTDHNPLTNTVLLAGKGIRGGLIVGSSDLQSLGENRSFQNVSKAHRALDPALLCMMGLPMDLDSLQTRPGIEEDFVLEHHLCFPSVVNTLFHLAGVKEESHFRFGPGSSKRAPVLRKLLTNA
ncbi:MAG TPA: DUF1501 domain-containing protein [Oligoflexus sp.]|uniref:DUF1501 domain-containing protein n=1 Tax=Oligoflexus sp. TaxID=1971216 RepID=UPI002D34A7B7|nr:DUF1501 domain-containing protein [Oligoflexus sp.]HYX35653.1 DUF1501 domain-containing protein [Oligoflexus sp.]